MRPNRGDLKKKSRWCSPFSQQNLPTGAQGSQSCPSGTEQRWESCQPQRRDEIPRRGLGPTTPHDKTKSTSCRSQIHQLQISDSQPALLGGSFKVNLRSEIGRFGPIVTVGGQYHVFFWPWFQGDSTPRIMGVVSDFLAVDPFLSTCANSSSRVGGQDRPISDSP